MSPEMTAINETNYEIPLDSTYDCFPNLDHQIDGSLQIHSYVAKSSDVLEVILRQSISFCFQVIWNLN